jgi:uncharacterized protein YjbI with pentapeptide repeats
VEINAARIEHDGPEPLDARQLRISESELTGVTVAARDVPGLSLSDVTLSYCDLSNVDGREGSLRRVQISHSRLVGFGLSGASSKDLQIRDSVLTLARFSFGDLRDVLFERVNLSEASFIEARLEDVRSSTASWPAPTSAAPASDAARSAAHRWTGCSACRHCAG